MTILNLPLTSNDEGQIIDAQGREIADCWAVDERGNIRVNDSTVPAMQATAAEIVRRVNLHEELVEALREAKDAAQAFTDPEDEMPQDTGEFRDLKESLIRIRAVLAKVEAR